MDYFFTVLNIITSIFTIGASGIAIYLFIFKQRPIKSLFKLLISYSFQISQQELKEKLEHLNDLNASDDTQKEEVINILNDIEGQIRGNSILLENCKEILKKITRLNNNTKELCEPKKRSLVSELRENLRNIEIKSYEDIYKR
jgi:DNA-binding FrmR family transcriptional regulator